MTNYLCFHRQLTNGQNRISDALRRNHLANADGRNKGQSTWFYPFFASVANSPANQIKVWAKDKLLNHKSRSKSIKNSCLIKIYSSWPLKFELVVIINQGARRYWGQRIARMSEKYNYIEKNNEMDAWPRSWEHATHGIGCWFLVYMINTKTFSDGAFDLGYIEFKYKSTGPG